MVRFKGTYIFVGVFLRGEIPTVTRGGGGAVMQGKALNYQGKRWQKLRETIMKRDGHMCQICKRYGRRVDARIVHHIYPAEDYPAYRWQRWNLISICNKCHEGMHDRENNTLSERGKNLMMRTIPPPPKH